MRDFYQDTIVTTDEFGDVTALSGVEFEVYYVNTNEIARLFEFPDPENTLQVENPVTTDSTGSVYFYADVGEYDIVIRDPGNRVGLTSFRWNAVNASPGGVPLFMMGDDIRRQFVAIGQVIDWWRPSSVVPLPPGFVPCDGRQVPAAEHEFTDATGKKLAVAITLPDLRNQFVMGADVLSPDASDDAQGAASANGDSPAAWNVQHPNAPGIGGTGGKNAAINLEHDHDFTHTHLVPFIDHVHFGTAPSHTHAVGTLYTADHQHHVGRHADNWRVGFFEEQNSGPGHDTELANVYHVHTAEWTSGPAGRIGIGGDTDTPSGPLSFWTNGGQVYDHGPPPSKTTTDPASAHTTNTKLPSVLDLRPAHVGLLKLMKVRRD